MASDTPDVPAWPESPFEVTAPPFSHITPAPRSVTAPSVAPEPAPEPRATVPTYTRSDVMAPLPEVIQPAPGPSLGGAVPAIAERYPALTPSTALPRAMISPPTSAEPVPVASPASSPVPPLVATPAAAPVASSGSADPEAWAHAPWNAYAHRKPTTDNASLSWEGPAVDIPRPAPMPREMDTSRLLTTLPPPGRTRLPSWWRVAGTAAAAAFLAAFGALALLPSRTAMPLASNLSDVRIAVPAAPTPAGPVVASAGAEPDGDEGALEEEVEETTPTPAEADAPAVESPAPAAKRPAPTPAGPSSRPRAVAQSQARWSPPRRKKRRGFRAAIAERKRKMGYIVARSTKPCVFYVDGTPHGAGRLLKVLAAPGGHRVTCRTEDGRQSQSVEVRPRRVAGTVFRL